MTYGYLVSAFVRRQLNITGAVVVKQVYDFNSFANVKNDRDESRMASGRLFQVRGPATANRTTCH